MEDLNKIHQVFVYGTLKSGGEVRGLDSFQGELLKSEFRYVENPMTKLQEPVDMHLQIVGKAVTKHPDFQMIDLGAFPGVVNGNNFLEGEVWEVDGEMLQYHLDAIEGYPNFYNRKVIETSKGNAWIYFLDDTQYLSRSNTNSNKIKTINNVQSWTLNG